MSATLSAALSILSSLCRAAGMSARASSRNYRTVDRVCPVPVSRSLAAQEKKHEFRKTEKQHRQFFFAAFEIRCSRRPLLLGAARANLQRLGEAANRHHRSLPRGV